MLLVTGFMLIGLNSSTATEVQTRTDSGIFDAPRALPRLHVASPFNTEREIFCGRNLSRIRNRGFPDAKQNGEGRRAKWIFKLL